jgi:hypothetical protein
MISRAVSTKTFLKAELPQRLSTHRKAALQMASGSKPTATSSSYQTQKYWLRISKKVHGAFHTNAPKQMMNSTFISLTSKIKSIF